MKSDSLYLSFCPFCGYQKMKPTLYEVTVKTATMFGMWRVGCGVCGFRSYRPTKIEAIRLWNGRAK